MFFLIRLVIIVSLIVTGLIVFKNRHSWEKLLVPAGFTIFAPILLTLLVSLMVFNLKITSKEYWNNAVVKVMHDDSWNQKVSCRHPIYRTERVYSPTVDSKGNINNRWVNRQVYCGDEHPFDVKTHDEVWKGVLDSGEAISISKNEYDYYSSLWEKVYIVEMNRSFYTKDGDRQVAEWNSSLSTIFPITSVHTYENRIRANSQIFTDDKSIDENFKKLFAHPIENGENNNSTFFVYDLPFDVSRESRMLHDINCFYGKNHEIHSMVFVLNASKYNKETVEIINKVWKGPNKNELDVFIGVDENGMIKWCEVLSWSSDKTIHFKIIEIVNSMGMYNGSLIVENLKELIPAYWHRRHFDEFKKLAVDIPKSLYIVSVSLIVISNLAFILFIKCQKEV